MRVVSFATYLTRVDSSWRDEDYHASKFVKAIKGKPFNGYANVPVGRRVERLTTANSASAADWFAEMAAAWLERNFSSVVFVLVPVPNSDSVVGSAVAPRTERIARAIAARLRRKPEICDCLRFDVEMASAHSGGGSRDPAILYGHLVTSGRVRGETVVLVDDVLTGGGHLRACAAKLSEEGACVRLAVVAGRTVQVQPDSAFGAQIEDVDDWDPDAASYS